MAAIQENGRQGASAEDGQVMGVPAAGAQVANDPVSDMPVAGASAMPAAGLPPLRFQTGKRYQVHKSYMFMGPLAAFAVMVIAILNGLNGIGEMLKGLERMGVDSPILVIMGVIVLVTVVLYGVMLGFFALSYRHLFFVFDDREFSLHSGVITKKRMHVPYARVQSVNQKAKVLQRIVGVCTIVIDTAAGARNKPVRVPYVTLATAEEIRAELFLRKALVAGGAEGLVGVGNAASDVPTSVSMGRKPPTAGVGEDKTPGGVLPGSLSSVFTGENAASSAEWQARNDGAPVPPDQLAAMAAQGGPASNVLDAAAGEVADWRGLFGGAVAGLEPVSYELGLNNRELLFTSFSHDAPFVVGLIVALSALSGIIPVVLSYGPGALIATVIIVGLTLATAVVFWVLGALGVAVQYGKFRVRRRGTRVEVERGLLQRTFSGIDVERIQSIEIRQTFIRRLIGYCELSLGRINSESQDSSSNSKKSEPHGLVIHPFVKLDQVDGILESLIPEYADRPSEDQLKVLPPVAKRRCLLRRCIWYNGAFYVALATVLLRIGFAFVVSPFASRDYIGAVNICAIAVLVVCAIVTAVLAVSAVLWARDSRYAWNRGYVIIRNSGLTRAEVCIPRQKIQSGVTRSNPFQRRLGVTSILAITAAGQGSTTTRLLDVTAEAGDAYLTWLQPRRRMWQTE